jgi:putative membrane protein
VLPGARIDEVALTPPPRRARWIAPVFRSRSACGSDELVFVSRKGLVRRRTDVIPHAKVQSLAVTQNPLTSWMRLAAVRLHTTDGPVKVVARLRDLDEAERILAEQAERSRIGRRADVPARWVSGRLPQARPETAVSPDLLSSAPPDPSPRALPDRLAGPLPDPLPGPGPDL